MTTQTGARPVATASISSGSVFDEVPALATLDPADPYPAYAEIAGAPFAVAGGEVVIVTDYATCSDLLRHPEVSLQRSGSPAFRGMSSSFFGLLDPPEHTRLRGLVNKAFTPRSIEKIRPWLVDQVHGLIDEAAEGDVFDAVGGVAHPLPLYAICHLLGVPDDERRAVMGWSKPITFGVDLLAGRRDRADQTAYRAALRQFRLYLVELVARRRAEPGDDLLTRLIEAEEEGHRLTEREIVVTVIGLLVAGHETTVSLISHGAIALLRHPELREAIAHDEAAADAFVDEVMRYDSPIQVAMRVAAQDLTVGELEVRAGTAFLLLVGAANRDAAQFEAPAEFRVDRANNRNHLGFGLGRHYCLGAVLGRLEARIALAAFAQRLVDPRERPLGLTYEKNVMLRSVTRFELDIDGVRPFREDPHQ